jgi:hypothetical protein
MKPRRELTLMHPTNTNVMYCGHTQNALAMSFLAVSTTISAAALSGQSHIR